MTDTNHPITPPPELVQQWLNLWSELPITRPHFNEWLSTQAARWGADQELEACCSWADATGWCGAGDTLRTARRSKPPSLKEQALAVLDHTPKGWGLAEVDLDTIRRALESLPD